MPYKDKEKERAHRREYWKNNKGRILAYARIYYKKQRQSNPEKAYKGFKKWKANNPEKMREAQKKCREKLKHERPEEYKRQLALLQARRRERYHSDPAYRSYCNARTRISSLMVRTGRKKKLRVSEAPGCTVAELAAHIESQFKEGMSWSNRSEWHIDHKRSCASFDLSDPAQLRECFHYTNLQPIWREENLRKWAHFDGYHHNCVKHRTRRDNGTFLPLGTKVVVFPVEQK